MQEFALTERGQAWLLLHETKARGSSTSTSPALPAPAAVANAFGGSVESPGRTAAWTAADRQLFNSPSWRCCLLHHNMRVMGPDHSHCNHTGEHHPAETKGQLWQYSERQQGLPPKREFAVSSQLNQSIIYFVSRDGQELTPYKGLFCLQIAAPGAPAAQIVLISSHRSLLGLHIPARGISSDRAAAPCSASAPPSAPAA